MRRAALILFAALDAASCHPQPAELAVRDAWVRLPAVPGNPAAAYFTVKGGPVADQLVSVDSSKAERIELHESKMTDGKMSMRPLDRVEVPAGGTLVFAPGANHAMVFGVDPSVQPNGTLPLTLHFASGKALTADAHAVSAGDAAPVPHDH